MHESSQAIRSSAIPRRRIFSLWIFNCCRMKRSADSWFSSAIAGLARDHVAAMCKREGKHGCGHANFVPLLRRVVGDREGKFGGSIQSGNATRMAAAVGLISPACLAHTRKSASFVRQ
jgi:hypothetical protein